MIPTWQYIGGFLVLLYLPLLCTLGLLLLVSKGLWTDIDPWQLLDQDGQIMLIVPGSSSLWANGQMVVCASLPEVSNVVHKQNKWLYVFSLLSQVFNGVSIVLVTVLGMGEPGVDRTDFCPLCWNSFFLWLKEVVCILFICMCILTKDQSSGMEEGTGEGSAYEKSTLPFDQVYCLNKNLILVWLLLLGLSEEKAVFWLLFSVL